MSMTRDDVAVVYDKWAKWYDEDAEFGVNPSTSMEGNSLLTLLRPSRRDSVLELGCGTGRLTIPIARKCRRIVAIDRSDSMLEVARAKSKEVSNIEFKKLDIAKRRLPFPSASFEKAISPLVLNHIENIRSLFKEISRVLKPRGIFVFDDIMPDSTYFKQKKENELGVAFNQGKRVFYNHSIDDYVHALHRADFQVEEIMFPRFDSRVRMALTQETYRRNKGHTLGIIVKAVKQKVS
jgi:ubiquinone/menaquinone biosynthesis C-methylase UbiE